ncbi:hypothetical protein ACFY7H_03255 [Streptomyces sp. NPDC012794]|uniref:hypothetical protein n=1 Tax=Streptomyces sp. NPDC012794 TaxID=3364850 RepID=UPI003694A9EC
MSRRPPRAPAAALFALVLGLLAVALTGLARTAGPLAPPPAGAEIAVRQDAAAAVPVAHPAGAAAGPARETAAERLPGRGPACGPDSPGHGPAPAVPPRPGQDHAAVPPARPAPGGERPDRGECVRVPVRGPDRPAPSPVELSVMRV